MPQNTVIQHVNNYVMEQLTSWNHSNVQKPKFTKTNKQNGS